MIRRLVATVTALAMTLGLGLATAGGADAAPGVRADDGAFVAAETVVADGVLDLTVSSPALRGTSSANGLAKVRLYLPADWSQKPSARWPSLYLLHGANDARTYRSWDESTSLRAFLRAKNVLTVMPEAGEAGFYADEWNYGAPGGMKWETFHTVELPQLLERGYRASSRRAVAGVSMGGFGAISYAARHPGMFGAAASYSGVLDTLAPTVPLVVVGVIRARAGQDLFSTWGNPLFNRGRWAASNPADLVSRLRGTSVYVSTGDGLGGTADAPDVLVPAPIDIIEVYSKVSYDRFVSRARAAGVPVTAHYQAKGAHYWTFWQQEFQRSWPQLAQGMGVTG